MRRTASPLLHSRSLAAGRSGVLVSVTPARAGWSDVQFAVRRLIAGDTWTGTTGANELCLVLLAGDCQVVCTESGSSRGANGRTFGPVRLGPRKDVFSSYPHAVYIPRGARFTVTAEGDTEIADCRAPATTALPARLIRPADCGCEVRGGGSATRQIIDILPPDAVADHLLICEVLTPGGNWSSYPPHKHDVHRPPVEGDLEETYYYRFRHADGYGVQRLYTADGRVDDTMTVRHGDLVLVREGYHPFAAAYGYDAYYLNVLSGSQRSMAASDDPRYAHLRRTWPAPDPRVPLVPVPRGLKARAANVSGDRTTSPAPQ